MSIAVKIATACLLPPMTIENLNQLSSLIAAAILVAAFFVPSLCEVVTAVGIASRNLSHAWQILHSHVWSRFPTTGSFSAFFCFSFRWYKSGWWFVSSWQNLYRLSQPNVAHHSFSKTDSSLCFSRLLHFKSVFLPPSDRGFDPIPAESPLEPPNTADDHLPLL